MAELMKFAEDVHASAGHYAAKVTTVHVLRETALEDSAVLFSLVRVRVLAATHTQVSKYVFRMETTLKLDRSRPSLLNEVRHAIKRPGHTSFETHLWQDALQCIPGP